MRGILRLIPFILPCAQLAYGAPWIRIATPEFELYTDAGEQTGRDAIAHFEQVRSFFLQASPVRPRDEAPVRIVIFRSREEFIPYAPNPQVIAYYSADEQRDYIAMGDGSAESYPTAIHEYTHLIIRHSGLHVPLWLNEGWADVYSSLRPVRDGVAVGDLLPGRLRALGEGKWLTLESLGAVTPLSPIYNESNRAGIFYAESWALAHMLFLSPDYKDGFARLLASLHQGKPLAESLNAAYRKSPAEVLQDLQKYFDRKKLYGAVFRTAKGASARPAAVGDVTPFESKLVLSQLLSAGGHSVQAESELRELRAAQPDNPAVAEALGYMASKSNRPAMARDYLQKAFENGTTDAKACFLLARLDQQTNRPAAETIAALERALQLKPDFAEAQVQLGLMRLASRDFRAALETLSAIKNIQPELASVVFSGLAYSALQIGDVELAREHASTAAKWARSAQEKTGVEQLSAFIEARSKSALAPHPGETLSRIEGTVTEVLCSPPPSRMRLQTGNSKVELLLPEPAAVEFSHPGGGMLQLSCGLQKPFRVSLEVAVSAGALGIIRRIEF